MRYCGLYEQEQFKNFKNVLEITRKKIYIICKDLDNIQLDIIITSLWNNLTYLWPKSFVRKIPHFAKKKIRKIIKKIFL